MGMMSGGMGINSALDTDGDGMVTPAEMAKLHDEYDTDGTGTLSIEEFEALNSALHRQQMVRHFQFLDRDGDGQVTAEEMAVPAERMLHMKERIEQFQPGAAPGQPGMMQGGQGMMDGNPVPQNN
jgi:hypothetical protein